MTTEPSWRDHTAVKVGAVAVSGLAVNWLSTMFTPTAPIVLIASLAALVLLILTQRNGAGSQQGGFSEEDLGRMKLGLVALLIGALVAAIWLLPLGDTRKLDAPMLVRMVAHAFGQSPPYFHNYELGAACTVAALAAVHLLRGGHLANAILFAGSAAFGMTLMFVSAHPENELLSTFLGWLLFVASTLTVVAILPALFTTLRTFFTNPSAQRGVSHAANEGHIIPDEDQGDRGADRSLEGR